MYTLYSVHVSELSDYHLEIIELINPVFVKMLLKLHRTICRYTHSIVDHWQETYQIRLCAHNGTTHSYEGCMTRSLFQFISISRPYVSGDIKMQRIKCAEKQNQARSIF